MFPRQPFGSGQRFAGARRRATRCWRAIWTAAHAIGERWTGGAVLALCAGHPATSSFAVVEGEGGSSELIGHERLCFQSPGRCGATPVAVGRSRRW
jgi:non-canonical (house-cleaning) NTP pyrophosphatase